MSQKDLEQLIDFDQDNEDAKQINIFTSPLGFNTTMGSDVNEELMGTFSDAGVNKETVFGSLNHIIVDHQWDQFYNNTFAMIFVTRIIPFILVSCLLMFKIP